jgi:hypothetical protein
MIDAIEVSRFLNRRNVGGFFDDADQSLVPGSTTAINAGIDVGDVVADGTKAKALLELLNRGGERVGILIGGSKDVEGEALSTLGAHAGELLQFFNQASHRLCETRHKVRKSGIRVIWKSKNSFKS